MMVAEVMFSIQISLHGMCINWILLINWLIQTIGKTS